MNIFLRNSALACLMACGFSGLNAAEKVEPGFQASLGIISGTGNDMKAMKKGTGYTFGLGYEIPGNSAFSYRVYLNSLSFEGTDGSGLTKERPHFFGGLDVSAPLAGKLSGFGGVLLMSWNQAAPVNVTNPKFKDTVNSSGTKIGSAMNGAKLGCRLGLDYQFVEKVSVNLSWTLVQANLAYNPSWLTLGVTYKF